MGIEPPFFDILLDPSTEDFPRLSDEALLRWVRFGVPEAIDEFNRRVAERQ